MVCMLCLINSNRTAHRVDDSLAGAGIHSQRNCTTVVSEFCPLTRFTVEEIKNRA